MDSGNSQFFITETIRLAEIVAQDKQLLNSHSSEFLPKDWSPSQQRESERRLLDYLNRLKAGELNVLLVLVVRGSEALNDPANASDADWLSEYEYVSDTFQKSRHAISKLVGISTCLAEYLRKGLECEQTDRPFQ